MYTFLLQVYLLRIQEVLLILRLFIQCAKYIMYIIKNLHIFCLTYQRQFLCHLPCCLMADCFYCHL